MTIAFPKSGIASANGSWTNRLTCMVRDSLLAQGATWGLWSPVFAGAGAAIYLNLRFEPDFALSIGPVLLLTLCAFIARLRAASRLLIISLTLLAFAAGGFAAGKIRTARVMAPVAPATEAVPITGWVVDVADPGQSGDRLLIAPTSIGGVAAQDLPARIRMTSENMVYGPGAAVRFIGLVNPPPPPASPGGFDFARNAFFDGIGGVGVALTDPEIVDLGEPGPGLRLQMRVNAMRWALAQRIAARMSPQSAGLGVAMVTGHEAWIDPETEQNLRDAGLAHLMAISGLHMAIVGGFAFFLARGLIAAIPPFALRVSGKKVAACFGLVAVGAYLVVSGAPPPAERAAITAAVAFGAILADRRAITLRALATAALIVIALHPEAVAEPGFQMSFAATAALVAMAELWSRQAKEINTPWPIRAVQGFVFWVLVAAGVSLVAGLATGPFAIQHFNRVAVFGLPANVAVQPLTTFLIMPFLALGATLEPLGLGGPFLWVASVGIDALQSSAGFTASRPGAVMLMASAPAFTLPLAFLGILWVCLWQGRGRWLGLPFAFAVALWPRPEAPVLWIDNEGAQAAIRVGETALALRPDARAFGVEYWTRRRGLPMTENDESLRSELFDCNRSGCRSLVGGQPRISIWWTARQPGAAVLEAYCAEADILVIRAEIRLPAACNSLEVLTGEDFEQGGAVEIYRDGRMVWAQPRRGVRPWSMVSDTAG